VEVGLNDRPRHYAAPISDKVTEMIRAELELVPKEYRQMVADEVINSIAITWELRKFKARQK
jgi:hypothetical protein